jgi:hypothetical protein
MIPDADNHGHAVGRREPDAEQRCVYASGDDQDLVGRAFTDSGESGHEGRPGTVVGDHRPELQDQVSMKRGQRPG